MDYLFSYAILLYQDGIIAGGSKIEDEDEDEIPDLVPYETIFPSHMCYDVSYVCRPTAQMAPTPIRAKL
ncbi:hypothetical protein DFH06DRAFT_1320545 [Mycena polygramma]|nr:hypothetical protein DFH06DRAFT_1320545 [Mycena polygramma]